MLESPVIIVLATFVAGTPVSVTITATDDKVGSTIYYTTDGTIPTAASLVYSTPLSISATTTINAIAIDSDGALSCLATQTYTFSALKDITVKFKPPTSWLAPINVHYWNAIPSANLTGSTWPGKAMTGPDANGYYSYTFTNIASINLVFDRGTGTPQTVDIVGVSKNTCYTTTGSNTKLDVVETDCTSLAIGKFIL